MDGVVREFAERGLAPQLRCWRRWWRCAIKDLMAALDALATFEAMISADETSRCSRCGVRDLNARSVNTGVKLDNFALIRSWPEDWIITRERFLRLW